MQWSSTRGLALFPFLLMWAIDAHSQNWQPPVGVPTPSFGIVEAARPTPVPWTAPVPNHYYVDATAASATDSNNPFGTPARPRRSIPTSLPAGAVVDLRGTYTFGHTSPRGIASAGTRAAPVIIRGGSGGPRAIATGCWELSGSFYIVEHVTFAGCSTVTILGRTDHAALRHSEVRGTSTGGGVALFSWNGQPSNDVVLYRNEIHDNGDVNAGFDQDNHGVLVGARASRVWIVDNHVYRNSGDGVQISAGSAALQSTVHHIWVARNSSHDNKQTGFWVKQAVDVVFSQNQSYRHRPGNSSMGACMGGQYAPDYVWWIDNVMWDCDYGIQLASDAGLGTGQHQFVIGNIITRIHDSNADFQPGSAWQNCAVSLPGGTHRIVAQNSLYDVDAGVCAPYAGGTLALFDNLVQGVRSDGHHVIIGSAALAATAQAAAGNLFAPNYRLRVGGDLSVRAPARTGSKGSNGVVADIGWVDPARGDFHLRRDSAAIDNGVAARLGLWATFQARYGVSMARDVFGASRSSDAAPDSGAVEHAARPLTPANVADICAVPAPPEGLAIQQQGARARLTWVQPAGDLTAIGLEVGGRSGSSDVATVTLDPDQVAIEADVAPGVWFIRMWAENACGRGPTSNELTLSVGGTSSMLTLSSQVSGREVVLTWTALTGTQTAYTMEAGSAPGLSNVAVLAVTGTRVTVSDVPPGSYFVRLRATDASGARAVSPEILVTIAPSS